MNKIKSANTNYQDIKDSFLKDVDKVHLKLSKVNWNRETRKMIKDLKKKWSEIKSLKDNFDKYEFKEIKKSYQGVNRQITNQMLGGFLLFNYFSKK